MGGISSGYNDYDTDQSPSEVTQIYIFGIERNIVLKTYQPKTLFASLAKYFQQNYTRNFGI